MKEKFVEETDHEIERLIVVLQYVIRSGNKRKKVPRANENAVEDEKEAKQNFLPWGPGACGNCINSHAVNLIK